MKKLVLLIPAFLLLCFAAVGQATYRWIGADNASWQESANWTPMRTAPAPGDILLFDDGTTKTVTAVPAQTIAQLRVTNNTRITLRAEATANRILNISGGTGVDLDVGAGSELNISGTPILAIQLGAEATGSISGSMSFTDAGHRLLALAPNAVVFTSGASFTAGSGFTGSAFGVNSHNSVIFQSGSTYNHIAGANPFGATQPNSVVVFQHRSLYRFMAPGNPAFEGREYADFEFNRPGTATVEGEARVLMTNFTVTQGTFNFNMTGTGSPRHEIMGNITVAPGATLNFNPTASQDILLMWGPHTISGGGTITANTNSNLTIVSTTRLEQAAQFHSLVIRTQFEISGAGQATITGRLFNDRGTAGLVLRSGASLLHTWVLGGNPAATMERVFSGAERWRLVASPVANQTIDGRWVPTFPFPDYDFYDWHEPNATWRSQKVAANNITHFVPGRGYLVSFQGADLTQSFAGPLNNGNVTVPVVRENTGAFRGANLLGNPYPSAIDWHLADRTLFADQFAYIYDPLAGNGGAYVPLNGANPGALIAPNQGFFVLKSAAGTANFTFTNAMRTHGGVFRSAPADPTISITLRQGEFYDRAQIVQLRDATTARERSDALKFFSFNPMMPQVFSMSSDTVQLAVNSTAPITEGASFNIGVLTPVTGTYTLQVEGLQEILAGRPAFLLDRVTGTSHNLREQSRISFHAVQSSTAVERFVLSFVQPTGVGNNLPVDATVIYFAHGMLHMQFAAEERNRQLQVIDLSGRVVLSKSLHGMGNVVSVPLQIDNGAYIVRITGETSAITRRILVR